MMAEPQLQTPAAVAAYKKLLNDVIDRRPSGTPCDPMKQLRIGFVAAPRARASA